MDSVSRSSPGLYFRIGVRHSNPVAEIDCRFVNGYAPQSIRAWAMEEIGLVDSKDTIKAGNYSALIPAV